MRDSPGTGIEPVSPTLAGGPLTAELPGKSQISTVLSHSLCYFVTVALGNQCNWGTPKLAKTGIPGETEGTPQGCYVSGGLGQWQGACLWYVLGPQLRPPLPTLLSALASSGVKETHILVNFASFLKFSPLTQGKENMFIEHLLSGRHWAGSSLLSFICIHIRVTPPGK